MPTSLRSAFLIGSSTAFSGPHYRIVDFYLPEQRLVVEIDGEYHNREKDLKRDKDLQESEGVRILRLTNAQVVSGEIPELQLAKRQENHRAAWRRWF